MNTGRETGKGPNYGMNHLLLPDTGRPDWEKIELMDWVLPMQECPQDPVWHAEGDVWTHTKMVVEALLDLEFYQSLDAHNQYILFLSALLHDIAKPLCTETDEDGRIISPKHAKVGEKIVRQLLWDADFEIREEICALVRLHGLPLWSLNKPNPNNTVVGASFRLKNQQLAALATADVLGRICDDQEELLERIAFFEELCLENDCWEDRPVFHNTHSQFKYFYKQEEYPPIIYDDTQFEVIMLSGIAGSGKDTYAATLDLPMISLDEIRKELKISFSDKKGQGRVAQEAYERAKRFSAKKTSFVWNSTNLTASMRMRIINALAPYNPTFKIVYIETSIEEIYKRRKETIPKKNLNAMVRILEMPLPTEVHEITYLRN